MRGGGWGLGSIDTYLSDYIIFQMKLTSGLFKINTQILQNHHSFASEDTKKTDCKRSLEFRVTFSPVNILIFQLLQNGRNCCDFTPCSTLPSLDHSYQKMKEFLINSIGKILHSSELSFVHIRD